MGWPTRDVALREMAKEPVKRRDHVDLYWPTPRTILTFLLAKSVPNRLAGVEINEDGDAI